MGRPPKTPNDDLDKFLLRMPDGLRDRVKAAADRNNRSMNAEIVATLEKTYPALRFDIGNFLEEWIIPILKMKKLSTAQRMARIADVEIKSFNPEYSVVLEGLDGKRSVTTTLGSSVKITSQDGDDEGGFLVEHEDET